MPTFLIRHLHKKTPKYPRKTCSHSSKIRKFASVITPEKVHIFGLQTLTKLKISLQQSRWQSIPKVALRDHPPLKQGLRLIIALTSAMKSLSPKPSLKKLPGAKNLDLYTKPLAPGNIFYSPSADSCPCRVHKFLFPNTPKNIRMYHPNFHEIIGRVTNFYAPTGYKKKGITSNA